MLTSFFISCCHHAVRFTGWLEHDPQHFRAKVTALDRAKQPALGETTLDRDRMPVEDKVHPGWFVTRIENALVLDKEMFAREWKVACEEHANDVKNAEKAAMAAAKAKAPAKHGWSRIAGRFGSGKKSASSAPNSGGGGGGAPDDGAAAAAAADGGNGLTGTVNVKDRIQTINDRSQTVNANSNEPQRVPWITSSMA